MHAGSSNTGNDATHGILIDATSTLRVDVASLKLDGAGQLQLNGGTITGVAGTNEFERSEERRVGKERRCRLEPDNDADGVINATGGTMTLNTGKPIDKAGLYEVTV